MCGLTAIFAYHSSAPPVNQAELLRIREAMLNRGPDGEGLWIADDKCIGLAHRRLAIIDLSDAGAQPMATPDGAVRIVFNGEIYNYRELRLSLESKGYCFRSHSDTEVLLYLYQEHGKEFVHHLRGMYAIAIWDQRKRGLFLARDPFGIKPLYYADNGKTIRVASQVKALLKGGTIDTTPEPAGHAGFFLWGHVPEPWTLYRSIRSLPAGHYLWVDEHGAQQPTPFCRISDILAAAAAEPAVGSRAEALEVIAGAVRDSIRAHLVSDVPVGVFLSAGLDSSMIAALASKEVHRPHTLTLAFAEYSGTENDEAPLAESLAANLGTRHATIMVQREDFEDEREKLLAAMDQPSIDGVNTWFVARAAATKGIKVALSGVGGDELFASYSSFHDLPRITRLTRPFARLPAMAKHIRQLTAPLAARLSSPKYAGLLEYGGSLGGAYLLRRSLYMPWELAAVLDPDMARQGLQALQTLEHIDRTLVGFKSTRTAQGSRLAVSALEMSWYMRNQLLRDTDWASMAHSLEIRTPFLDTQLLKTVAPWLSAYPTITKPEITAAIAPKIPSALLNKPKTGFTIPARKWLMEAQENANDRAEPGLRSWAAILHNQYAGQTLRQPGQLYVYRTGQLGDTLVALPALSYIASQYPNLPVHLITNKELSPKHTSPESVLRYSGWLGDVIKYEVGSIWSIIQLARQLRQRGKGVIYHLGAAMTPKSLIRDWVFFRCVCGLNVEGVSYRRISQCSTDSRRENTKKQGRISEQLMSYVVRDVARCGAELPHTQLLRLPTAAVERAPMLLAPLCQNNCNPIVAIGAGSKMPAKIWPIERYKDVVRRLNERCPDTRYVLLGSPVERQLVAPIENAAPGKVLNLCGMTNEIESAAVLSRCSFYLGNDTGTMHLAATMGLRCVAIFSARDTTGYWNPVGDDHIILRKAPPCCGCMLENCEIFGKRCLMDISIDEVTEAAIHVLDLWTMQHKVQC